MQACFGFENIPVFIENSHQNRSFYSFVTVFINTMYSSIYLLCSLCVGGPKLYDVTHISLKMLNSSATAQLLRLLGKLLII